MRISDGKYGSNDFPPEQRKRRRVFEKKHGSGPWKCFYCNRKVVNLVIHHIDENHLNDKPSNLAPIHKSCHAKIHRIGKRVAEKTRKKISLAAIRIAADPAERQRRSERAKRQHATGNFGTATWRDSSLEQVIKKNRKSSSQYIKDHPEHFAKMIGNSREMSRRSRCRKIFN